MFKKRKSFGVFLKNHLYKNWKRILEYYIALELYIIIFGR
ncbi:hypothetical protein LEP1GSC172_1989 [Leptospira noguchii]|uniref:Uncharacterized protein n=2 Tax=Leptospira noguchii TaxID=28182 RepID=T0FJF9_9LEPT|nr:hypothetical protein LEP1GSC172_1989 [Leptospira noguchii]EQA69705.1 hypothetical protein LEP1GSC059_1714 [Leptospira noguchii serovar Panama str. CZ214]